MPSFDPDTLAAWTGGRWSTKARAPIDGFTMDTRHLRKGQMFVALRTSQRDGHDFLGAAERSGASGALVSRADTAVNLPQLVVEDPLVSFQRIARENRRRFKGPVIGVTGSAGKTSTKNLLALILGPGPGGPGRSASTSADRLPSVVATEGNLNNHLGVPLTLSRLDPAANGYAVVEAGISAPGEMDTLAGMIEPDVAIVTLVAPAHLAELGGLEGVAREKSRLPASVRPGGIALFPDSCLQFSAFRSLPVKTVVVGKGAPGPGHLSLSISHRADTTELTLAGTTLVPSVKGERFVLRRVTDGMAQNAALAIGAALYLGIDCSVIGQRVRAWQPAALRGEIRSLPGQLWYLDCYNANPASMADALTAFSGLAPTTAPRLFVIGGMEELGPDSERFHLELGQSLALKLGDRALVIGDQAQAVKSGALLAGASPTQVEICSDPAIIKAQAASFQGSIFVKGSRRYQLESVFPASEALAAH